ncbi:MAG: hypothetical protein ACYS3N_06305 [Planctomycetota bacterium]|jgi:hypothetical protein
MKKKRRKNFINLSHPPSVCRIIDDAIEQRRNNERTFDIEKHISKYNLTDKESEEALVGELVDAIFLDDLFREFEDLSCHTISSLDQDI